VIRAPAAWALAAALVCVTASPGTLAAAAAAQTHQVVIEGMAFAPKVLTVNRGDRVVWVNRDLFPHTATAEDRSFDSGEIPAGKSWSYVARRSDRFAYVCTLHPGMKGTLLVR
jgi:plastocyanin